MAVEDTSKDEAPDAATSPVTVDPVIVDPVIVETVESPPSPASFTEAPPPPPAVKSGGGFGRFLGLVTGGALAAGAGFGLATYGVQQGWPILQAPAPESAPTQELAALKAEVARLAALPSGEPAAPLDLKPLEDRLTALETAPPPAPARPVDLAPLEARMADLEARLASATPGNPEAITARIEAEVAARMQEVTAETDRLRSEAEALQARAAERAALLTLQGAMASGLGLPEAIAGTASLSLPPALTDWAKAPVTRAALRDSFPETARLALAAARAAEQAQGTTTERLTTFLMNQTGARSTTARAGDDPDAVLSRMEAAVSAGDLPGALALRAALPEVAQPPLADWAAQAEALLAAETALAALIPAE